MQKIIDGIRMEIPDDATRETLFNELETPLKERNEPLVCPGPQGFQCEGAAHPESFAGDIQTVGFDRGCR